MLSYKWPAAAESLSDEKNASLLPILYHTNLVCPGYERQNHCIRENNNSWYGHITSPVAL